MSYFSWISLFPAFIPVSSKQVTGGTGTLRGGAPLSGAAGAVCFWLVLTFAQVCRKNILVQAYHEVDKVGKHFAELLPLLSNHILGSGTPNIKDLLED